MKTAIISGITGQDGALLADLLLKRNYKVVGLIAVGRSSVLHILTYLGIADKITLKKVDPVNQFDIEKVLEEFEPDEFYNLAALSSVGMYYGSHPAGIA